MLEYLDSIAATLGVSSEVCLVIIGLLGALVGLLVVNMIFASLSARKSAPASAGGYIELPKKKALRDRFLIAGPTFAGKT